VPKMRAFQQHRIGHRALVAVEAVTARRQYCNACCHKAPYMRTCTVSSVKSSDVAKLKASILSGGAALCYRVPWVCNHCVGQRGVTTHKQDVARPSTTFNHAGWTSRPLVRTAIRDIVYCTRLSVFSPVNRGNEMAN
jgi:hypothetical protein